VTTPAKPRHRRDTRHHTRRRRAAGSVVAPVDRTPPSHSSAPASVPAPTKVLHPGSGSGVLWMLLAGALVLVVGGLGGFALSRGHGRAADPGLN